MDRRIREDTIESRSRKSKRWRGGVAYCAGTKQSALARIGRLFIGIRVCIRPTERARARAGSCIRGSLHDVAYWREIQNSERLSGFRSSVGPTDGRCRNETHLFLFSLATQCAAYIYTMLGCRFGRDMRTSCGDCVSRGSTWSVMRQANR